MLHKSKENFFGKSFYVDIANIEKYFEDEEIVREDKNSNKVLIFISTFNNFTNKYNFHVQVKWDNHIVHEPSDNYFSYEEMNEWGLNPAIY
jgi:hypothetical protein